MTASDRGAWRMPFRLTFASLGLSSSMHFYMAIKHPDSAHCIIATSLFVILMYLTLLHLSEVPADVSMPMVDSFTAIISAMAWLCVAHTGRTLQLTAIETCIHMVTVALVHFSWVMSEVRFRDRAVFTFSSLATMLAIVPPASVASMASIFLSPATH